MIGVVLFATCAIVTVVAQDPNSWQQNPNWAVEQNWGQSQNWGQGQNFGVPSQPAAWPQTQNTDNSFSSWPGSGRSATGFADTQSQAGVTEDDGSWKPDVYNSNDGNDGNNGNNGNDGQWSPQQQWNRRRRSADPMLKTLIQSSQFGLRK